MLPDDTAEKARNRHEMMKEASREQNTYSTYAAPYLSAQRTLELYEGYNNLEEINADYDKIVAQRKERHDALIEEQKRLAEERRLDKERYEAKKKMKK